MLLSIQRGIQQNITEANNRIHRGPNFMAHISQERGSGCCGLFGGIFGYK